MVFPSFKDVLEKNVLWNARYKDFLNLYKKILSRNESKNL